MAAYVIRTSELTITLNAGQLSTLLSKLGKSTYEVCGGETPGGGAAVLAPVKSHAVEQWTRCAAKISKISIALSTRPGAGRYRDHRQGRVIITRHKDQEGIVEYTLL